MAMSSSQQSSIITIILVHYINIYAFTMLYLGRWPRFPAPRCLYHPWFAAAASGPGTGSVAAGWASAASTAPLSARTCSTRQTTSSHCSPDLETCCCSSSSSPFIGGYCSALFELLFWNDAVICMSFWGNFVVAVSVCHNFSLLIVSYIEVLRVFYCADYQRILSTYVHHIVLQCGR